MGNVESFQFPREKYQGLKLTEYNQSGDRNSKVINYIQLQEYQNFDEYDLFKQYFNKLHLFIGNICGIDKSTNELSIKMNPSVNEDDVPELIVCFEKNLVDFQQIQFKQDKLHDVSIVVMVKIQEIQINLSKQQKLQIKANFVNCNLYQQINQYLCFNQIVNKLSKEKQQQIDLSIIELLENQTYIDILIDMDLNINSNIFMNQFQKVQFDLKFIGRDKLIMYFTIVQNGQLCCLAFKSCSNTITRYNNIKINDIIVISTRILNTKKLENDSIYLQRKHKIMKQRNSEYISQQQQFFEKIQNSSEYSQDTNSLMKIHQNYNSIFDQHNECENINQNNNELLLSQKSDQYNYQLQQQTCLMLDASSTDVQFINAKHQLKSNLFSHQNIEQSILKNETQLKLNKESIIYILKQKLKQQYQLKYVVQYGISIYFEKKLLSHIEKKVKENKSVETTQKGVNNQRNNQQVNDSSQQLSISQVFLTNIEQNQKQNTNNINIADSQSNMQVNNTNIQNEIFEANYEFNIRYLQQNYYDYEQLSCSYDMDCFEKFIIQLKINNKILLQMFLKSIDLLVKDDFQKIMCKNFQFE